MGCSQSASKPVQRPVESATAPKPAQNGSAAAQGSTVPAGASGSASAAAAGSSGAAGAKSGNAASGSVTAPSDVVLREVVQHRPLIVAGPSGVGKGTLLTRLLKEYPGAFAKSVSHTTRAPRAGETHGVSYHFTSPEELLASVAAGKFIEHANVHGNYYGTSIASVSDVMSSGRLCLLEIDIQGVLAVRAVESLQPRCVFIRPPTFGHLADRLAARGSENAETTQKRLDTARQEMDFFYTNRHVFDADIINDDLEQTYQQLIQTIKQLYPQLEFKAKHHAHGHAHGHAHAQQQPHTQQSQQQQVKQ